LLRNVDEVRTEMEFPRGMALRQDASQRVDIKYAGVQELRVRKGAQHRLKWEALGNP
jgi:hypothetical protein